MGGDGAGVGGVGRVEGRGDLDHHVVVRDGSPRAAAAMWARIDRRLVDRAAWVPMVNERGLDFVSDPVRNYEFHPYWGLITDQLWLAGH